MLKRACINHLRVLLRHGNVVQAHFIVHHRQVLGVAAFQLRILTVLFFLASFKNFSLVLDHVSTCFFDRLNENIIEVDRFLGCERRTLFTEFALFSHAGTWWGTIDAQTCGHHSTPTSFGFDSRTSQNLFNLVVGDATVRRTLVLVPLANLSDHGYFLLDFLLLFDLRRLFCQS